MKFEIRKTQAHYWLMATSHRRVLVGMSKAIALTATIAAIGAMTLVAGAPAVPLQGPIIDFQMRISGPGGKNVLKIRSNLVVSHGKISPTLCEGRYQIHVEFTRLSGHVVRQSYDAKVHRARLNKRTQRCPYSGLPRQGLRSLQTLVTVNGQKLMTFNAKPSTRAGETFNRLSVSRPQSNRVATLSGRAHILVLARYRTGRTHLATFLADIARTS